jgi:hypothetical protein
MMIQRLDCTPTFVSEYPKLCADPTENFRQPWSVHDMGAHYPVADGMWNAIQRVLYFVSD